MNYLITNNETIIKSFESGAECHIFDCVTNTIRNQEEALKCTSFIYDLYLKDSNYTPLGHLSDYVAERWDDGIQNKDRSDILIDFYNTLY